MGSGNGLDRGGRGRKGEEGEEEEEEEEGEEGVGEVEGIEGLKGIEKNGRGECTISCDFQSGVAHFDSRPRAHTLLPLPNEKNEGYGEEEGERRGL